MCLCGPFVSDGPNKRFATLVLSLVCDDDSKIFAQDDIRSVVCQSSIHVFVVPASMMNIIIITIVKGNLLFLSVASIHPATKCAVAASNRVALLSSFCFFGLLLLPLCLLQSFILLPHFRAIHYNTRLWLALLPHKRTRQQADRTGRTHTHCMIRERASRGFSLSTAAASVAHTDEVANGIAKSAPQKLPSRQTQTEVPSCAASLAQ